MRNSFINELLTIAETNHKVWLLTGDLGFGVLEPFKKQYADRFINVGVAEQNMAGIAAGLALSGNTVFIYSIANFPTFRCLEQIRNDICYHKANVKIVSVGAGVAYGAHGYTHYGVEDIAIMRCLPNMRILSPADPQEARRSAHLAVMENGPVYIRLGKNGEPIIHEKACTYKFAEAIELSKAAEITLIATGSITLQAYRATEILNKRGIKIGCYSAPSLAPFDNTLLQKLSETTTTVVTLEEHGDIGGLGSILADQILQQGLNLKLVRLALPSEFTSVGNQEHLLKSFQLDAEGVADIIMKLARG